MRTVPTILISAATVAFAAVAMVACSAEPAHTPAPSATAPSATMTPTPTPTQTSAAGAAALPSAEDIQAALANYADDPSAIVLSFGGTFAPGEPQTFSDSRATPTTGIVGLRVACQSAGPVSIEFVPVDGETFTFQPPCSPAGVVTSQEHVLDLTGQWTATVTADAAASVALGLAPQ